MVERKSGYSYYHSPNTHNVTLLFWQEETEVEKDHSWSNANGIIYIEKKRKICNLRGTTRNSYPLASYFPSFLCAAMERTTEGMVRDKVREEGYKVAHIPSSLSPLSYISNTQVRNV